MGNFGYKLPEGIRGEVGSTASSTIRTGIAVDDIKFGDFVELTNRELVDYDAGSRIAVRTYTDLLDQGIPVWGVAAYKPSSSDGNVTQFKYFAGSSVDVVTEGDIRIKVIGPNLQPVLCLAGDPCYMAYFGGEYLATTEKLGSKFQIGTFAETLWSTGENSVLVALRISQDVLVFNP